eukprot:PhM_4_TR12496/c0_g1_i1/m.94526
MTGATSRERDTSATTSELESRIEVLTAELQLERDARGRDRERFELLLSAANVESKDHASEVHTEALRLTSAMSSKDRALGNAHTRIEALTRTVERLEQDLALSHEAASSLARENDVLRPTLRQLESELEETHARMSALVKGYEERIEELQKEIATNAAIVSEHAQMRTNLVRFSGAAEETYRLQKENAESGLREHKLMAENAALQNRVAELSETAHALEVKIRTYEGVSNAEQQLAVAQERVCELEGELRHKETVFEQENMRLHAMVQSLRETTESLREGLPRSELLARFQMMVQDREVELAETRLQKQVLRKRVALLEKENDVLLKQKERLGASSDRDRSDVDDAERVDLKQRLQTVADETRRLNEVVSLQQELLQEKDTSIAQWSRLAQQQQRAFGRSPSCRSRASPCASPLPSPCARLTLPSHAKGKPIRNSEQ